MASWNSIFSQAVRAGYGGSNSNCGDGGKKGNFSTGRLKSCDETPQTHMYLPAGGLSGLFNRNKEEGMVKPSFRT